MELSKDIYLGESIGYVSNHLSAFMVMERSGVLSYVDGEGSPHHHYLSYIALPRSNNLGDMVGCIQLAKSFGKG